MGFYRFNAYTAANHHAGEKGQTGQNHNNASYF